MRILSLFLTLVLTPALALAAEGMWTLDNLPRNALQKNFGFEPEPDWVRQVQRASVRLAAGCSGSFVSPEGLVLTNHHCLWTCIEQLSSADENLLQDGFYAAGREAERQCPNVELNQLMATSDVTAEVSSVPAGDARRAAMSRIEQACVDGDDSVRCDVVTLYHGGRYHLYRYKRYDDVRLVWSPELKASFFGGDPDNFNFPRYVLDASFLRAYENGTPAATPDHFNWNAAGAEEEELVFVTGHPGTTQRLLTVAQLQLRRDLTLLDRLLYVAELRGMLNQYASRGDEQARYAQSEILRIENTYKVLRGQLQALQDPAVFAFKQREEQALRDWVQAAPARIAEYGQAWDRIAQAQEQYRAMHQRYAMIEGGRGFQSRLFSLARALVRAGTERTLPSEERMREYRETALQSLERSVLSPAPIYSEYEEQKLAWSLTKLREVLGTDDPFVQQVFAEYGPETLARKLVRDTRLFDVDYRRSLWEGGAEAVAAADDPMIQLARRIDGEARALYERYENEVETVETENQQLIARVLFELEGTDTYPDATLTLRLSYGQVRGWREGEREIPPFTELAGAYRRHTGNPPYALSERWLAEKDALNLQQRMNMVTTHDIIGGNSGSPMINRDAEVVGLIFDGNIHSLGGAYWYDERLNRAVSVHAGFIAEALRSVYNADALLEELGLQRRSH
ncbi:S46 family peptidase [Kineobactrum salinum]|uniref:Dipeptidyl-peptidase n=1 Tax=Kineobactrum salinum TaxID=2708301 RepID=A0A6C0U362_9GAMM|nr:S46 family peptidase [Kineobactrum salinum]QIB66456.1 S46 family peptidase [Kineobactrum salinum]